MIIPLIFGVLLGATTVIFALQNTITISVTFFSWQLQGSLALVLMASVVAGMITALLLVLPESIGNYFKYKKLLKENAKLTEDLRKQKELTVFAKSAPYVPEEHGLIQ